MLNLKNQIELFNTLNLGTAEERLLDKNRLLLTEMFNEAYQEFRKSINGDIKEFGNPHEDQLDPYRNVDSAMSGEMYAFSSIPRTQGVARRLC